METDPSRRWRPAGPPAASAAVAAVVANMRPVRTRRRGGTDSGQDASVNPSAYKITPVSFRRALGPFDATMVVIGGIVGSGIFINPYLVARTLDTPALVLGAWIAGGAIALAGAFAYAELGQRLPKAGGQYVYLSEAWHPVVGFLYGWALLFMIETGAIAAVAIVFADHIFKLAGMTNVSPQQTTMVAVLTIVLLSVINYIGVKPGSRVLNVFVVLKIA